MQSARSGPACLANDRTPRRRIGALSVACAALALGACNGTIGGPVDDHGGVAPDGAVLLGVADGGAGDAVGPPTCGAGHINPGPAPLRRLSRAEYTNSVHDLFPHANATYWPTLGLPADQLVNNFENNVAAQQPAPLLVERFGTVARTVADYITTSGPYNRTATNLANTVGCHPTSAADETACGHAYVADLLPRAFRRAATADELADFTALFDAQHAAAGGSFAVAVGFVIETVLQSPEFLYRAEFGAAPAAGATGPVALTSTEMATRLSYFLWNSTPDATLLAAAAADQLATPEQVQAQATRMLADPRAHGAVADFHRQWFGLDAYGDNVGAHRYLFGDVTPANADFSASLRGGTEHFLDYVFWGPGTLGALLTDTHVYVDSLTAQLYDVPAPTGTAGQDYTQLDLAGHGRAGILTQAGTLSSLSMSFMASPVRRGVFVLSRLLCQDPPAPPPDVVTSLPQHVAGNPTVRQRFAMLHEGSPTCAGCHREIDNIGFGFEAYDALGRYITTEAGQPVDSTGTIQGVSDPNLDRSFDGALQLSTMLAGSPQVQQCVVTQWFRFGFGRTESDADACTLQSLNDAFAASHGDLRDLVARVVMSDAFRYLPAASAGTP